MKDAKKAVIKIINAYQKYVSPLFPKSCRFYPSCSQFAVISIESYGIILGIYLSVRRILKCHPFNPGGIDFPEAYEDDFFFRMIERTLSRFRIIMSGNHSL
ncbi:MAG TPA: membrane protein insertion efficiency factor YidD [Peptococcaceae bacterium]|nr:MAG: Putative membrane protein insertion efficiency factor [Clostridia bacterium 41_269]HBT19794.1 membrane protein insertion efficiency factor YidD [Peptococcaceae bacterium]